MAPEIKTVQYSLRRVRDVSSYSNFNRSRASKPILPRGRLHLRILIVGNRLICSDYRFDRYTGDTTTDHVRSVYCNLDELRLTSWLTIKQFLFCKILTELSHKTVENVKEKKLYKINRKVNKIGKESLELGIQTDSILSAAI